MFISSKTKQVTPNFKMIAKYTPWEKICLHITINTIICGFGTIYVADQMFANIIVFAFQAPFSLPLHVMDHADYIQHLYNYGMLSEMPCLDC